MSSLTNAKASVVLVHGGFVDGSGWEDVYRILKKDGYEVSIVQNPTTSLEADVAATRQVIASQRLPVILVGHSYGGAVITGAAHGAPNVAALVYIAAFGLDEGESLDGLSKQGPATAGAAHIRPDDNGFLWIDDAFPQVFAGDVDPIEASVMAAVQKPLSLASFTDKSGPPAWKSLPSWYLVSSNDQMIPPQAEEFMAKRMGATTSRVQASHASMVSHAQEVADVITEAADSIASQPVRRTA